MKKIFTLIIMVLAIALLFPYATVLADVLIEPDDDFYNRHRSRMRSMNRSFYANGENGYITLLREPDSRREVISFENGKVLYIMFTFDDDGTVWGITEVNISETETRRFVTGWVQMDNLHTIYDSREFFNEHEDEFISRPFDISDLDLDGDLVMWSWPGSGKVSGTYDTLHLFGNETNMNIGEIVYIDKFEREWGYMAYFYGFRDVWICITEPSNSNILAFNPAPAPDLYPAAEPGSVPASDSAGYGSSVQGPSGLILAATLVSLAVTLSLVLIFIFWNKKAKKK